MSEIAAKRLGGWPLLGVLPEISRRGIAFYVDTQRTHGDVVSFDIGGYRAILLSDPAIAREVLRRDVDDFRKGFGNEVLEPLIGHGLFLSEGDTWRHLRRVEAPMFTQDAVAPLMSQVDRHVEEMVEAWSTLEEVDLYPEIVRRTLAIVSHTLLGTDHFERSADARRVLDELWRLTQRRMNPVRRWLEPGNRRRFQQDLGATRAAVRDAMRAPAEGSVLASMVTTDLDEDQILDDALTFIIAGQECTPLSIAWSLYFAASGEVRDDEPVENIVREAMRLRPPAWMMARQANRDTEVGSLSLSRDTVVLMSPLVMHRHPGIWPDADTFDASRFEGDRFVTAQKRAFMPFGSGPRTCVGMHLALRIAHRMVGAVLERYRLVAPPGSTVPEGTPGLTLRPERPLLVHVHKR